MNIFITSTDTDVGKTYVSAGIVKELAKRGLKTGYFKPLQSGIVPGVLSDADNVIEKAGPERDLIVTKNSYVTKTPATPSVSAEIDNVKIDINKIISDYNELKKECDIVAVEGSGGLYVPVNDTMLVSDIIKALKLPVIVVARPDLGTINHILLTLNALYDLKADVLGVAISNYPKDSANPVITTAPKLIEKFSAKWGKPLTPYVIEKGCADFQAIVDKILNY